MSVIRLRHVEKIYKVGIERINALAGVDLDVERNEFVAVMGASGSGKSTLMNILGCLDRPTNGTYELDGKLVSRMGAGSLARVRNDRIGFVFQSFELLPRHDALRNVELPLIYSNFSWLKRRRLAKAALQRVGLADRTTHKPNQLSGGQKQRVAIARALVANPAILLADEPTGNLDSRTTAEILALIEQLHDEGQTIIMVTHEDDVAARAKRIVRMRDGKIFSDRPSSEDDASTEQYRKNKSVRRTGANVTPDRAGASEDPDDARRWTSKPDDLDGPAVIRAGHAGIGDRRSADEEEASP